MDERQKFLATLEAAHAFPGPYMFKLIGDNEARLMVEALEILNQALPGADPKVTRRESGKGNHQAITVEVEVPDAATVHDIYESMRKLPGLRVLL